MTAFFGILDHETHRMTYLSAGQGPLLISRADGTTTELDIHGPPLGLFPDVPYDPPGTAELHPGDMLVLLTDGFYEWAGPEKDRFGAGRMRDAVRAARAFRPRR